MQRLQSIVEPRSPAAGPISCHCRWMIRRDMEEVLQIERAAFDVPWLEEDFIRCLRERNCIGQVAEIEERGQGRGESGIAGFMVYELYKTRIVLLDMAVRRDFLRRGVGGQLLECLKRKLDVRRRSAIVLEVGEKNLAAHLFFRHGGFRCVKILREPYSPDYLDQDAYRFVYRIWGGK